MTLPQLMSAAVEANSGGTAVVFADGTATVASLGYAELDERSTRLARYLIDLGVGPESLVAVGIPRSIESVLAVWAVAKTGAGFVPVDPNYPADRVAHMVTDSGAVLGLTVEAVHADLPLAVQWLVLDNPEFAAQLAEYPVETITGAERTRPIRAEHPAYVIYTSGSTGTPKGVVVTQAGLAGFCEEQRERYMLTPQARTLHFASPSFDASVLELLLALGGGATMVVVSPEVLGGDDLVALLRRERVTHGFITPAVLASIDPAGLDDFRVVVAGGEACPPELVRRWAIDGREFFNGYGPTETTIMTNISDPLVAGERVTIGAPTRGITEFVLDERLSAVPDGVTGELYITGAQLARGYHDRSALTAVRFVANPFDSGSRLYRTGDLVRRLASGELEYLGRNDFQVKIRGFRIELGEIDAVLAAHDTVDFAVTVGHTLDTGATMLAAYVHAATGAQIDVDELTAHAARSLPAHMVPQSVTVLDRVPLTPVGKLDRAALPAPQLRVKEFRAPEGRFEKLVATVYAELLEPTDPIGADDDFFELGGNSLIATRVAARLGAEIAARVPARLLFTATTVAELAAELVGLADQDAPRLPLTAMPRPDYIPLSLAQQRMWFLSQFDAASAANNIPFALRLTGPLDVAALRAAFADLIERHESLRTVYPVFDAGTVVDAAHPADGSGYQLILPTEQAVPQLPSQPMTADEIPGWLAGLASTGFDVAAQVPLRVALAELGPEEHVLAVVAHHITADGASIGPFVRDLLTAFLARRVGATPVFAPLAVQYADYTLWQRAMLGTEHDPRSLATAQIQYWRDTLAGVPDRLDLPADRARPTVASGSGAVFFFDVDPALQARIDQLAHAGGASPFMVVHSAFAALLARLAGQDDIVIGSPVAGRGEAALDDLVGMFVNTLVLRTRIDPSASFAELLAQVKETDLAAFSHSELPFERLVEVLDPVRTQAHHPLFQVALFFNNFDTPQVELPGLTAEAVELDGAVAKFDLQLSITPKGAGNDGLTATFTYATELFDEATVAVFAERFVRLLESVTAAPDAAVGTVELLGESERERILRGWNDTRQMLAPELLLDGYRRAVLDHPDAIAVHHEGTELTYREFDQRVNRLARLLIERGVGTESLVGLALRRSLDLVVGMYAIVTAGGAYVPLDPDHPAERIAHILDTAQPTCVLSTGADAVAVPAGTELVLLDSVELSGYADTEVRPAELLRPVRPENPAYVIFTSGSTGRPKGVAVSHAAIHNQTAWMLAEYPLGPDDVYLQKTATTFDVSLWGYFMPLRTGAKLVVATHDGHRDPAYVAEMVARHGVTVTDFVPSMLTVFATHTAPGLLDSLREVFVIGEALPPETVAAFAEVSAARVHNLYGPTEAAVSVTYWQARGDERGSVPIGLPEWNVEVYVLDGRLRPVPAGVPGELYLAGDQLARGYVRRPDLTSDRFVASPFGDGARMYRTGDLVLWRAGVGELPARLDYIGRTDFQVKFRGQRIELGEIETALLAQPSVSQVVALVMGSALGDQLVAYAVPTPGHEIEPDALRAAITEVLPAYMIPSVIVALEAFPLNPSGKLDRKALPEPVFGAGEFRAPATPVEEIVASAFAEVLGIERVGADDDFFALGGNSLVATQVVARLGAALGDRVPVRALFETPTVTALAAAIGTERRGGPVVELGSIERPQQLPLSLAQQRMWFLNRFEDGGDGAASSGSAAYNLPFALRLTGDLDVAALSAAFDDVVARHEVLRTVYPETAAGPSQVVLPVGPSTGLTATTVTADQVAAEVYALAMTPFDVTRDVPIRVRLLAVEPEGSREFVLAVVAHHIAADGSSMGPLVRDIMTAYAARTTGGEPGWAPLAVQYADYALWQRAVLGDEDVADSVAARQLDYWRTELADLPDLLELPADRPRPAVASLVGARRTVDISPDVHAGLVKLAREHNATLFMVVHTAFAVLMARLSGSTDIAIGTPVAGRGERELDDLIGMFVNTVVFRTRLHGGESFADLLAAQRETDLAAFSHADIPFERLVEALSPPRTTAHHPLFQVGLSFQNMARSALELPGLTVAPVNADTDVSQFDLHLIVSDGYDETGAPTGIGGFLTYATELFDEATVVSFLARLDRLLAAVVADASVMVGDIELLAPAERTQILDARNATTNPIDTEATLVSLLDATVAADPKATALVADDGPHPSADHEPASTRLTDPSSDLRPSSTRGAVLSYAELDAKVNRLARHLISLGVGPESRVALAMRRSVDLVVAMYAVAKSGGAYVPVDPDQAAERTDYILETAAPVCVLTNAEFTTDAAPVVRIDELGLESFSAAPIYDIERTKPLRPENTAYVIFTSGSTGRPKGVAVPHAAVVNQLLWKTAEFDLGADDAVLLKTAATFDLSVWEFWSAAVAGARLVIAAPDGHRDPAYLDELMARERVTTLHAVPSMLDALLTTDAAGLAGLRRVLAIGEALPATVAQRLRTRCPELALYNLYGPTEAAVSITSHRVTAADTGSVSIGTPEWNSRVYVLDSRLNPVPDGVSGELYLSGAQLARGYHGLPAMTADRFVADPFGPAGARMYRTGDLVAWRCIDGELDYRGRTDFQVKIRGFRIELGEIEAALLALPEIAKAAVIAKSDPLTGDRLVAYLVGAASKGAAQGGGQSVGAGASSLTATSELDPPTRGRAHSVADQAGDANIDVTQIKSVLSAGLPSYMVPAAFVVMDALPLNVNGKLDRKALPEPEFEAQTFRAPSTPIEEIVAGVFADVLGADRVGADDDFFALGGNSLLATQVAARLGAAFDTRVPVRVLFEASTVAALAVKVERYQGAGGRVALTPRERPARIPLSLAQQRMWFVNQFDTAAAVYNVPAAVQLTGAIDVEALRAAVVDVLSRHEVLRTVYPQTDGVPEQVVLATNGDIPRLGVGSVTRAELRTRITAIASAGFDVTTEVPVRAELLRITDAEDDENVLVLVAHHIAADGWSMAPLTRDLMIAYAARSAGAAPGWAPLPVQYADFSLWQRESLGDESDPASVLAAQANYWRTALSGAPDELNLPTDRMRPARATYRGGRVVFAIDPDLAAGLHRVAREHNATLFMVAHAALAVLLARLCGTADVVIGTPIAGRGEAELDELVGMFVNTLVLRTEVDERGDFAALLEQVRSVDLAAFAHADMPFERLVELVEPHRSPARNPLFQVALALQNVPESSFELPGLRVAAAEFDADSTKFDLQLTLREQGADNGIYAELGFARDLFDEQTVAGFAARYQRILTAIAASPVPVIGDLELLDTAEQAELLTRGSIPGAGRDTLADILTAAVAADGDRIAVIDGDRSITYAELDRVSSQLARALIVGGAGPEKTVAIAIPRSADNIVAIWAVVKTGAAFLPVDPRYPSDRLRHMMSDSGAILGVTVAAEVAALPLPASGAWFVLDDPVVGSYSSAPLPDAERLAPLRRDNAAYMIYTSGSTGLPKGVTVTHAGIADFADTETALMGVGGDSRVLTFASPSFDASLLEFLLAFRAAATLVISPPGVVGGAELAQVVRANRVTHAFLTPLVAASIATESMPSLTELAVGGDKVPAELVSAWSAAGSRTRIRNMYGPTEATVASNISAPLRPGQAVLLGAAIPGARTLVLDSRLRPVPDGVAGELYLGGPALARGYHARPDLTASRFVADPFGEAGSRLYRTGDLVRWVRPADGGQPQLEYLGRTDFQVKVRGFRIELGEIDTVLEDHADVEFVVTVGADTPAGSTALVSYVVPVKGRQIVPSELTAHAARRLPAHMVPSVIMALDAVPLTPVGKLDRNALPAPVFEQAVFRPAQTPNEIAVAQAFADVLGLAEVGLDDDFFALGGNSLSASQVVARLRAATGADLTVASFFSSSTVAQLAERTTTGGSGKADFESALGVLLPIRAEGTAPPLICLHPMSGLAWVYSGLAEHLPAGRPILGIQSPALTEPDFRPATARELVERYVAEVRAAQPHGPYHLLGWSLGGTLAHAVATELRAVGEQVDLVAMLDSVPGADMDGFRAELRQAFVDMGVPDEQLPPTDRLHDLDDEAMSALSALVAGDSPLTAEQFAGMYRGALHLVELAATVEPAVFDGDLTYFTAMVATEGARPHGGASLWRHHVAGVIADHAVVATHQGMTAPAALATIAPVLAELLDSSPIATRTL
ncbi:amino acid adenylation domain-containing protein [Nocardia sp. NPDC058705]|uniref:non-ribosomal peptide synthetase n=1 Tax=Nocardia sp. NPDC058705 TaxID=3346609 RepID=UPI0036CDEDDD